MLPLPLDLIYLISMMIHSRKEGGYGHSLKRVWGANMMLN